MRARIEYEGFDQEESLKLKPFLRIADYFSIRWNRTVVLNAPHGKMQPFDTNDAEKMVYVHFFSAPEGAFPAGETPLGYAKELFGFTIPREDIIIEGDGPTAFVSGNDVGVRLKARGPHSEILSPEGQALAQVVKNHIYILFDLAHRPFDGAEPLFWEILERAQSHLEPEGYDPHNAFALALTAHKKMREKTAVDKDAILPQFAKLSRLLIEEEWTRVNQALEKERIAVGGLERELMEIAARIELTGELLNDSKGEEELSSTRLRQEFEDLHLLKSFLGMEVRGDEITFYTRPIEHVYAQTGDRNVLSQYKIVIKPGEGDTTRDNHKFGAIKMAEWGWLGPAYHPETTIRDSFSKNPQQPCFGSSFVNSILKALLDQDYPVLIALLLHYLGSDNRGCTQRSKALQSKEQYDEKPFYLNDHARNQTREHYIELTKRFRGVFRKRMLEAELAHLNAQEREKTDVYARERKEYMLLQIKWHFLLSYLDGLSPEKELDATHKIPALSYMKAGSDFVWALFGPGKGIGIMKDNWFSGTFRVLIFLRKGGIRVWGNSSASGGESGFLQDRIAYDGSIKNVPYIKALVARGLFGKALTAIHSFLRGGEPQEESSSNIDELTQELVDVYLKNNAFPPFEPPTPQQTHLDGI